MASARRGSTGGAEAWPAFSVAAHPLFRINPTPAATLDSRRTEQDAEFLAELRDRGAAQHAVAERLTGALYELAGRCERRLRNEVVLPLRRSVHQGRLPRQPVELAALSGLTDPADLTALAGWLRNQQHIEELRGKLAAGYEDALDEERTALREVFANEQLRRSLAASSEFLPGAADNYRAVRYAELKKRHRKSEEALLRYAMRASTKTSPFSRYTVVGFLDDIAEADGGLEITATGEINRGLLRRIEAALGRIPPVRDAIVLHPSAGLRIEDGRFVATGDRDRLGPEAAAITARYGEAKVTAPATPAALALLGWLRGREHASARFAELSAMIAENVPGADLETAAAFVDRLRECGVLSATPIVDDHTPDALGHLCRWLACFDDQGVAAIVAELARLRELSTAFLDAGAQSRVDRIREGRRVRDRALELLGDPVDQRQAPEPVWFEDCRLAAAAPSSTADWSAVLGDCRELLEILQIFDEQHVFSRVLNRRFTARYGTGGECADFDELGEIFVPAYDEALRITEGERTELTGTDPVLSELVDLRGEVLSGLITELNAGGDAPVRLDPAWQRRIKERAPAWLRGSPASYGVFLQPVGGNPPTGAVLNKIYNGWGNYLSRFLTGAPEDVVHAVRRNIRAHQPPGHTVAELRPVQGFNANIHPLLADADLDWDERGGPGRVSLDRLVIRHDPAADRVVLTDPDSGTRISPLYLGFLIPYYLPSRLLPLTAMAGSGSVFFEPQVSADRESTVDRGTVRHYRRVAFGSLCLARERWLVPAELFPRTAPGETEQDYFVRLNEWRVAHGIPAQVFVHPPAPELQPGGVDDYFGSYMDNRKPQYVGMLSRLQVRHLDRLLVDQPGTDLVLEEALPAPRDAMPIAGGRHATELVAEFYRKAAS